MTDVEILKALKKDYDDGRVSVLVGSGFTKNAYAGASNWAELLKEMVGELYGTEITMKPDYKEFLRKKGYLKVVDEYIEHRGCREAIEVYIEEHIPYVKKIGETKEGKNSYILSTDSSVTLTEDDFRTHIALLKCDNLQNVFTTNYDNFIETAYSLSKGKGMEVIKSDYDLSSKRMNDSIFKIHGSLIEKDKTLEEHFEFDGDKSRRYIISTEDYRDYKQKHEAFSYYMRIALLAGKFCLIGFSGDDPNYKGWLEWVKDVLDKEPKKENDPNKEKEEFEKISDDTKVYLIDLSEKEQSTEQKLYNQNHRITVLRLLNKDVTSEFNIVLGKGEGEGKKLCSHLNNRFLSQGEKIKALFGLLFCYLRQDKEEKGITKDKEIDGLLKKLPVDMQTEKEDSPSTICKRIINLQQKNKGIDEEAKKLIKLREETRFLANVDNLGYIARSIIRKYDLRKANLSDMERYVFLMAKYDCGEIIIYPDNDERRKALFPLSGHEGYDLLSKIRKRIRTLEADSLRYRRKSDADFHENVLRYMYNLEFSQAKKVLAKWEPKGRYIAIKASMNFPFVYNEDIEKLKEYIDKAKGQERYLAINIYDFISLKIPSDYDKSEFKTNKTEGYNEITDNIFRHLIKEDEDLDAYGKETQKVIIGGNDVEPKQYHSLRLLNFLADTGILPVYGILYVMNIKKWYAAFSYLVTQYPYPCLFYSCLFDDKKVLKRIGQDYIYSKELYDKVPELLKKCLSAIISKDTPLQIKIGLQFIAAEFYEAVKEDLWIDDYVKILEKDKKDNISHPSYRTGFERNAMYGMIALQNEDNISRVLTVCLQLMSDYAKDKDRMSEVMPMSLRTDRLESLNAEQCDLLKNIIVKVDFEEIIPLLTKLKYSNILPEDVQTDVSAKMEEALGSKSLSRGNLYNIASFSVGNDAMMSKAKQAIISRNVWQELRDGKIRHMTDVFPIMGLRDKYRWAEDELEKLKDQLKESFKGMTSQLNSCWSPFLHYDELLRTMSLFLKEYGTTAEDKQIADEINDNLAKMRGWSSLRDVLYSDKPGMIEDALKDLNYLMATKEFSEYKQYFDIVLGNVVRKNKPKLSDSLMYVARVLHKDKDKILKESSYVDNLKLILKNFDPDYLREDNLIVRIAMPALISIAEDLGDNLDKQDEALNKWLADDLKTKYNNDYRDWVKVVI